MGLTNAQVRRTVYIPLYTIFPNSSVPLATPGAPGVGQAGLFPRGERPARARPGTGAGPGWRCRRPARRIPGVPAARAPGRGVNLNLLDPKVVAPGQQHWGGGAPPGGWALRRGMDPQCGAPRGTRGPTRAGGLLHVPLRLQRGGLPAGPGRLTSGRVRGSSTRGYTARAARAVYPRVPTFNALCDGRTRSGRGPGGLYALKALMPGAGRPKPGGGRGESLFPPRLFETLPMSRPL